MSSCVGFVSFPSNGIYCASKFAVEGLTQALATEVASFGITCVLIEPGYFRTEFLADGRAGQNAAPAIDAYDGTIAHQARDAVLKADGVQRGDPKRGAARIWEYVADEGMFKGKKKLLRMPLGSDCGGYLKDHIAGLAEILETYEDVWKSTDFPEGE